MPRVTRPDSTEILEKYLKEHGISKAFLAKKLGISESQLSYRLHVSPYFTADFALMVSKALGISPDIFLTESYKNLVTKK